MKHKAKKNLAINDADDDDGIITFFPIIIIIIMESDFCFWFNQTKQNYHHRYETKWREVIQLFIHKYMEYRKKIEIDHKTMISEKSIF